MSEQDETVGETVWALARHWANYEPGTLDEQRNAAMEATVYELQTLARGYLAAEAALGKHHRVGYGLQWGEVCDICAALQKHDQAGAEDPVSLKRARGSSA